MRAYGESAEAVVVKMLPERAEERRAEGPRECDHLNNSTCMAGRTLKSEGVTISVASQAQQMISQWILGWSYVAVSESACWRGMERDDAQRREHGSGND